MELALQVVGLKMTGKIEDAKNVAMRIVGAGEGSGGSDSQNSTGNMMQLSTTATRDLRSLMLLRAGESDDFETLIVNFLKLLDTPVDHPSAHIVSTSRALRHRTKSGQSLLHLAAFLGYTSLVEFLVQARGEGIDVDMRDRNGYTALHLAAMAGSKECVKRLLKAGADWEIVNAIGKTAEEVAVGKFDLQEILKEVSEAREPAEEDSDDEEAQWGDAEEEAEEELPLGRKVKLNRRVRRLRATSRKASREEFEVHARQATATATATTALAPGGKEQEKEATDEKQALSFIDMLQRTMAQLPGAPQLPQFPQALLPGVPAVPWGEALNQFPIQFQFPFPMVFPVAVPLLPGWLSGEQQHNHGSENAEVQDGADADTDNAGKLAVAFKTAQEWRTMWEKWLAHAPWQATEMPPPPQYTPRAQAVSTADSEATTTTNSNPTTTTTAAIPTAGSRPVQDTRRRFDYDSVPVTDQEVKAYAYQPKPQQKKREFPLASP